MCYFGYMESIHRYRKQTLSYQVDLNRATNRATEMIHRMGNEIFSEGTKEFIAKYLEEVRQCIIKVETAGTLRAVTGVLLGLSREIEATPENPADELSEVEPLFAKEVVRHILSSLVTEAREFLLQELHKKPHELEIIRQEVLPSNRMNDATLDEYIENVIDTWIRE